MKKLKLCQYPKTGFGKMNMGFYLLDKWGHRMNITHRYDKITEKMNVHVEIGNDIIETESIEDLLYELREIKGYIITKW